MEIIIVVMVWARLSFPPPPQGGGVGQLGGVAPPPAALVFNHWFY